MTSRSAMSMFLVLLLLVTSILGPNALCLCSDGCIRVETERTAWPVVDTCCPGVHDSVMAAVGDACCEWCIMVAGDGSPKLLLRSDQGRLLKPDCVAFQPVFSPRQAFDAFRVDQTMVSVEPPSAIAHLRTVRLLI